MKTTKKLIFIIVALVLLICVLGATVMLLIENLPEGSDEDGEVLDIIYPTQTITDTSFFEDTFKKLASTSKGEYINENYEKFPPSNNPTNLQSRGTASYEIGGKTVTADAFYRNFGDALHDPNTGMGILLYQAIQYKIANPKQEMKITFTSYRVSPTIAVCVDPESRYYGYARSLYGQGNDYDSNGFVRIAYMLVEAAKMGIEVTIVGQLNSYAVKQYDENGELKKKSEASYIEYFNAGLKQQCYDKYAKGKKVSEFMTFRPVKWGLADKGGTDMMHLKSLTASHYLDTKGKAHKDAIFLSSSNLDAIDYKGCNGNGGAQSGVIVTGHAEMYNATVNYTKLMAKYYQQEKLYEFRNIVNLRNTKQAELILAGREAEIPQSEQLLWLGSEEDKVFKLTFTPVAGDIDAWNTDVNPYCEQVQNLYNSARNYPDDYRIFTWNLASYSSGFNVSEVMADMVNSSFIEYKNPENRVSIRAKKYNYDELAKLKVGTDIAHLKLKNASLGIHSKDIMLSYIKNDERQYVSLLSSCNFHSGALYYQTNSIMTITETDETGNDFFMAFGKASTDGCIK